MIRKEHVFVLIAVVLIAAVVSVLFQDVLFAPAVEDVPGERPGWDSEYDDCHCESDSDCPLSRCLYIDESSMMPINYECVNGWCVGIDSEPCDGFRTCQDDCTIDYGDKCEFDDDGDAYCNYDGTGNCCGLGDVYCVGDSDSLPADFPNRHYWAGRNRGAECVGFPDGWDPKPYAGP